MTRGGNLLFLLGLPMVAAALACSSDSAALALTSVAPSLARLGVATTLQLRGEFPSLVVVDFADAAKSRVDVTFVVTVGDLDADHVIYVDATTINAVMPAGLAVGIYDVSVRDPRGRTVTLAASFTLVDDACIADGSDPDTDGDGIPDCNDGCPNDPDKRTAGFCGCGVADTDSDTDGTADCNDGCVSDPDKTAPGACGCGVADIDRDTDGTPDCSDGCPDDHDKLAAGACGCGVADTDANTNGTPDCLEADACPTDPAKTAPGICGCGVADTDTDTDGTPDCNDGCPNDINKTAAGACGCGAVDTDSDSDGTADCIDGCPGDPAKTAPGTCGCGNTATSCAAGFCMGGACASGCNVLTNGSEQLGDFSGWTLTQQCGDGWHVDSAYCDVRQAPEQSDGWVGFTSFYVAPNDWCKREQTVDLVARGFSTTLLDSAPTIEVGEWVRTNCFDSDGLRIIVQLQKGNGQALATWDTGAMPAPSDWALQTHTFNGYGVGLRKIRFSDQGRDTSLWTGSYGTAFDGAYATVMGATCP